MTLNQCVFQSTARILHSDALEEGRWADCVSGALPRLLGTGGGLVLSQLRLTQQQRLVREALVPNGIRDGLREGVQGKS